MIIKLRMVFVGATAVGFAHLACASTTRNNVEDVADGGAGGTALTNSSAGGSTTSAGPTTTTSSNGVGGPAAGGGGGDDGNAGAAGDSGDESTGGSHGTSSAGGSSGGTAGEGGDDPAPSSEVGSVGEPCSPNSAYGCAGTNQRVQLICDDGVWANFGQCSASERCDTRQSNAGLCEPIVTECTGKAPGDPVCRDEERFDCGPDLVTREDLETCAGGCMEGACTECCAW